MAFISQSVLKFIGGVESVIEKMTGNTNFVTPLPSLADITLLKDALATAAADAKDGSKEQKADVKVKARALRLAMRTLGAYVETIANENPLTASKVALSSGMGVKRFTPRKKPLFQATNSAVSGIVKVFTGRVAKGVIYDFEYTLTPDDVTTYVSAGLQPSATRTIAELESGKTYWFRWQVYFIKGASDWSDPISLVVM